MPNLTQAALWYARKLEWPVLPLWPGKKEPMSRHGVHDATTDIDQLERWWRHEPGANVGLGAVPFWVLDIDQKADKDGFKSLRELEAAHEPLPRTVAQVTGGGGRQLFFQADARVRNRVNANKIAGLDVRHAGGYVVAPPSIHPDTGARYVWARLKNPLELPLAVAPEWLIEAIAAKAEPDQPPPQSKPLIASSTRQIASYAAAAWAGEQRNVLEAGKGERNHRLFHAAARLFELAGSNMLDGEQVQAMLECCAGAIGLNPDEYRKTIASGKRHGFANPRQVRYHD